MVRCPQCGESVEAGLALCTRCGASLRAPGDPLIGATLAGRYKLVQRIGAGGMSTVYLARHVLIDRLSAIKILRRDLSDDPIHRDRFLREARAVNRINHDNIVEITDYGESEDGLVYLVMEYIPGQPLPALLARGALPVARALDLAAQIAAALGRAHQMGVIHRDLKPDNILVVPRDDGSDLVKILDFGIAKVLDAPGLSGSDQVFGTPGYIAPEYATGGGDAIDGRADLYSLGVVLYEMLTGALPFEAELPTDLLLKHVTEEPIAPRARQPSLPGSVERLVLRCLAKDPEARFRDAFHLLEELARVRAELTSVPAWDPAPRSVVPPAGELADLAPEGSLDGDDPVEPDPEVGRGLDGPRAWAHYLHALRERADARFAPEATPPQVEAHFARLERTLDAMSERAEQIASLRTRLLGLEARGRDLRTTIGRAMDALARDLSHKLRERDEIAATRDALERERLDFVARSQRGERRAAGEADARLWQVAASDEVLRQAVRACEDLEFQREELGRQLERLSNALETDQSALVSAIDAALAAQAQDDLALRARSRELDALFALAPRVGAR